MTHGGRRATLLPCHPRRVPLSRALLLQISRLLFESCGCWLRHCLGQSECWLPTQWPWGLRERELWLEAGSLGRAALIQPDVLDFQEEMVPLDTPWGRFRFLSLRAGPLRAFLQMTGGSSLTLIFWAGLLNPRAPFSCSQMVEAVVAAT